MEGKRAINEKIKIIVLTTKQSGKVLKERATAYIYINKLLNRAWTILADRQKNKVKPILNPEKDCYKRRAVHLSCLPNLI